MKFDLFIINNLFNLNNIIIIGWITLIFAPLTKLSKCFILLPVIFLFILLFRELSSTPLHLCNASNWLTLWKDVIILIGTSNYIHVINLCIGHWMVCNFYSEYTIAYSITINSNGIHQIKKSWTFGRIIFTIILLLTFMKVPFGFLIYYLLKYTFLKKYKSHVRINITNDYNLTDKINMTELQYSLLNRRYVRFGDQFPESLQQIYYFILGIIGILILFIIALPIYIILVIYCRIIYRAPLTSLTKSQFTPNKLIPEYVRNITASMKLKSLTTSIDKRNWLWYLKFLLLQFSTFIEYILNSNNPIALFNVLEDYFIKIYNIPYFAFGDGIGVASYELVKRYLQDIPPCKGYESSGWKISSSQSTFCNFSPIFLSSDNSDMKLSRHIIFQWLHAFPYNLHKNNFKTRLYLSRIVPRKIDVKPNKYIVYQAVGEVLFFLATGGQLTKIERLAYIECVKNPFLFFPDWFNFLLFGHYFERKTLNSYYILLQAFSRYINGPALSAAIKAGNNKKSKEEILKLITIVFSIAGSIAPAKLALTVINKLWSKKDQQININLFKKNPQNFIKECARLDKSVPIVNVLATNDIIEDLKKQNIHIYENTPIHCSIVNANRDKNIFQNPNDFNPERKDLNKIIVWNGVEEDILNKDETKRPIRYCPGHDLSLDVIQYVVERFLPVIIEDNHSRKSLDNSENKLILMNLHRNQLNKIDQYCYNVLDNYTKLVMKLMHLAVQDVNLFPSRAIDICEPFNFLIYNLDIYRIDMAKFIPSWDEDIPNGAKLLRRIARWIINNNLWNFHDCLIEFNSLEQAIQWRFKMFPALPLPNIIYTDMLSDNAMTQLAFSGCACHYTYRIEDKWINNYNIFEQKILKDVVYVNDMTCLSIFRVRKPFERYGAAAYFDKNYQIIAIYWSHASRLVKKGEQFWEHVKYVWRSSFFAYITINDHLIVTHMIESNGFVSASRQCLPSYHILRRFIKPFTYHSISINHQAAISLINKRGLVHRVWAFDYDEFLRLCDYNKMNYKFRLLPDFISKTMHPKINNKNDEDWDKIYPIYRDLNAFWKIIRKYVETFFQINYHLSIENDNLPKDSYIMEFINELCKHLGISSITSLTYLIDVISQLIASSTGIHEHVGQISDYLIDPRFVGTKLQEGIEIQNIQTYSQILTLSIVTGLRMPGLLEDWSHLIEHNQFYSDNLKNYRNFKRELEELSQDIDRRNKIRNYPFQSFNPKYMECSTSV